VKKSVARAVIEDTINVINLEEEKKRKTEINDSVKKEIYQISVKCNNYRMTITSCLKRDLTITSDRELMKRYRKILYGNSYLTEEFVNWRDSKKLNSEEKATNLKKHWLRNLAELEQFSLDIREPELVLKCEETQI
jgi:hypothetical protein